MENPFLPRFPAQIPDPEAAPNHTPHLSERRAGRANPSSSKREGIIPSFNEKTRDEPASGHAGFRVRHLGATSSGYPEAASTRIFRTAIRTGYHSEGRR